MTEIEKGYRMYFLVANNLSSIQKGIQAGHCAERYAKNYGHMATWENYVDNHKTWIVLNGGTTNSGSTNERGSLDIIGDTLVFETVMHAKFYEPDLNNALTAICFLADEKVWNFDGYPPYEVWSMTPENIANILDPVKSLENYLDFIGGSTNLAMKNIIYRKPLAL